MLAAPDRCLYYTTWSGMADADATSSNTTERLMGERELRQFSDGTRTAALNMFRNAAQDDPESALLTEIFVLFANVVAVRPTAIFLTDLEMQKDGLVVQGAVVTNLGDAEEVAQTAIARFRTIILPQNGLQVQPTKIDQHEFDQIQSGPPYPTITWGIKNGYLIIGVGSQAVETTLQRMQRASPPDWLVEQRAQIPLERRATFTFADLTALFDATESFVEDVDQLGTLRPLGFDRPKSYTSTSGLDESGFVSRTRVEFHPSPAGIARPPADARLVRDDFKRIPADAMAASVLRTDPNRLLSVIREVVSVDSPHGTHSFDTNLRLLEMGLGIRVQEDVLAPMGDLWTIYASPRDGGLMTSWVLTVSLRDRAKFLETSRQFATFFQQAYVGTPSQFQTTPFEGTTICTILSDEWTLLALSWAVCEDHLAIALFPQALKSHIRRGTPGNNLADLPEIARTLETDPTPCFMAYADTRALVRSVYPLLQLGTRMAVEELREDGTDLRFALLPSVDSIARHLNPNVMSASWTDNRLMIESHGTVPASMTGVATPVVVSFLLPAAQSARLSAIRHQSITNLSQISTALHNYHDAHHAYPAAYSTDEHGKPLLSWRVHILPYMNQKALHDQFHLDEPWSSKHNRQLIRAMPAFYRPVASATDPGKTNYLGVRGEGHLFAGRTPGDKSSATRHGMRMQDVEDGTSNTIAVVESCDQLRGHLDQTGRLRAGQR